MAAVDAIKKWWFLIVPVVGFLVGAAAWASEQNANDATHTRDIRALKERVDDRAKALKERLDRIESKLDRLVERGN